MENSESDEQDIPPPAVYVGAWIKYFGLKQYAVAEAMGCEPGTLSKLVNGKMAWTGDYLGRAARALDLEASDLFRLPPSTAQSSGRIPTKVPDLDIDKGTTGGRYKDIAQPYVGGNKRLIRVAGEVEAGVWREASEHSTSGEQIEVVEDRRFAQLQQVAFRLRGSSMNQLIPDGYYVVCVSYIELGREPVSGELVVVQRRRADGLVECTVKEFVEENGRRLLYPRSFDAKHQDPISLNGQEGDEEIAIIARVIDTHRKF